MRLHAVAPTGANMKDHVVKNEDAKVTSLSAKMLKNATLNETNLESSLTFLQTHSEI